MYEAPQSRSARACASHAASAALPRIAGAALWVALHPLPSQAQAGPESAANAADPAPAPDAGAETPAFADAPSAVPAPELSLGARARVRSEAGRLRSSARAVTVIETRRARREAADLGAVIAREEGIAVRRSGGLGTPARLSLAGLGDARVPVFLDGLPLELTGHPFGLANVPVNAVQRIDVYRGVVPIRLGADALGGAIELVTDADLSGTHAEGSYQVGSFGTRRLALAAHHRFETTPFFARASGFADHADNDFAADVEVADEHGRQTLRRLPRFHDGYGAASGRVSVGLVGQPWAERLSVQGFFGRHERQVQHDASANVPYGEVEFAKTSAGGDLRYAFVRGGFDLDARLAVARIVTDYRDLSKCRYDWYGRCVSERLQAGETSSVPIDQRVWQHAILSRLSASQALGAGQTLRFTLAPSYERRVGDNRALADEDYDPLNARRRLVTLVAGAEHESAWAGGLLENIAFAKHYAFEAVTEEELPNGRVRPLDRSGHRFGAGDSLRLELSRHVQLKASYEYATRLPSPEELFGDGALVVGNLHLEPEVSHNANLGAALRKLPTPIGAFGLRVAGLLREVDRMIVRLNTGTYLQHDNVLSARVLGVEAGLSYESPGRLLHLDGNATYRDVRNVSRRGALARFHGSRIPNRPYLFAHGAARLTAHDVLAAGDELAVTYRARYVHAFYLGWEQAGARAGKLGVPAQLVHDVVLALWLYPGRGALGISAEVHNLTDARAFDFYGVPRPGRAFFLKTTIEI